MEMLTIESPDNSLYMTAPNTPSRRVSFNSSGFFYSAPTSPTSGMKNDPFVWDNEAGVLKKGTEFNFDNDFEFETSKKFESLQEQQQQKHGEDLPAMAFADELFCNGQVLPLKLPPRLQYGNNRNYSNPNSSASSPRSVLKGPFSFLSFQNEDFDPFMTALENVRKEERRRDLGKSHRRARSLSPLRSTPQWFNDSTEGVQYQNKQMDPLKPPMQHIGFTPSESTEPKQLSAATRTRCLRLGLERATNPTLATLYVPNVKTSEVLNKSGAKSEVAYVRGSKRQRIKDFLFRSASDGRADTKDKLRDHTAALRKSQILRKFSFKSLHRTHYSENKGVSREPKKTLIPYRPSMFLCLGFGLKGLRKMN